MGRSRHGELTSGFHYPGVDNGCQHLTCLRTSQHQESKSFWKIFLWARGTVKTAGVERVKTLEHLGRDSSSCPNEICSFGQVPVPL